MYKFWNFASPRRPLVIAFTTVLLLVFAASARAESEIVHFPVTDFMGETIMLSGKLMRPEGDGPFPALVLLHGCSGMTFYDPRVKNYLLPWGYVLLAVDSFQLRGIANVCGRRDRYKASPQIRALDAHAGKDFLANLPYVDDDRIAVMGWSHGGRTVLAAVSNWAMHEPPRPDPFKAAIAFYPYCQLKLPRVDAPLLALIGDADDWASVQRCRQMELTGEAPHDYQLIVYPGAAHSFDFGANSEVFGHKIIYDPAATENAYMRAREFLERYLKQASSYYSAATNLTYSRLPVAAAQHAIVFTLGSVRPLSSRAMTDQLVPMCKRQEDADHWLEGYRKAVFDV